MKGILLSAVFSLLTCAVYGQSAGQHVFICPGDTLHFKAAAINAADYSWYKNGEMIPGQDSSILLVTSTGHYDAIAANSGGCESDSSASVDVDWKQPVANQDTAFVNGSRTVNIYVLNNDVVQCAPFDKQTINIVQFPKKGGVFIDKSGFITYTSNGQSGTDMFEYNVRDENNVITNTAVVNILINDDCAEVYPNPTVNQVSVNVLNPAINIIRVVDMSGHILFTENATLPVSTVDISMYPNGAYILQLLENNTVDCTYTVIKKQN